MQAVFRILGPIEVLRDGEPIPLGSHKQRAVLAILLIHANEVVSTDRLIDDLWGEVPPPADLKTLRSYISRLRAALGRDGDQMLVSQVPGYVLRIGADQLDADVFVRLAHDGRVALQRDDPVSAGARLRDALSLWRGSALADLSFEPFATAEINRLEEVRLVALEDRLEADLALGLDAELVGELEALIAEHPLREGFWRQLMLALYRSRRQPQALRAYHRCQKILVEELGVEPGPELQRLHLEVLRHEIAEAPPRAIEHNLPARLTSFVGREREREELQKLLADSRLVTVTGVGGSGKSSLAAEVGAQILADRSDGVWLVELSGLSDPMLVPHAAGTVLGVPEPRMGNLIDVLIDRLRTADLLLILDNCEHLLGACAGLSDMLLRSCPSLRVLATSREPLGVDGEIVYRVPPLPFPEESHGEDLRALGSYDSVRLFLDRASAARGGVAVDPTNIPTVAKICGELDGLPLSIELAAARARALTIEEIAEHLDDRFRFLRAWTRTGLPHHRTLQATMDWSYELLPVQERAVLRRLGAFAGRFTLEAAAAVCADLADIDLLDALDRLVQSSLLFAEVTEGTSRYRLLETVKRYGTQRLEEDGEAHAAFRRHAGYFLQLAERAWEALETPDETTWFSQLEECRDDLRAALDRSLSGVDPGLGVHLVRALGLSWLHRGHREEGLGFLERALAIDCDAPTGVRVDLLGALGAILARRGDLSRATPVLEQAVAHAREIDARLSIARCLHYLALVANARGEYERARPLLEEAISIFRDEGNQGAAAWSILQLADYAIYDARFEEAERLCEQGFDLVKAAGSERETGAYLETMARLAIARGEVERGESLAVEGLTVNRRVMDSWNAGANLINLARARRAQGDAAAARAFARDGLAEVWKLRDLHLVTESMELLASIALESGMLVTAAELFAASSAFREAHGILIAPAFGPEHERGLEAIRSALGPEAFGEAWLRGEALSAEEAVSLALSMRSPTRSGTDGVRAHIGFS